MVKDKKYNLFFVLLNSTIVEVLVFKSIAFLPLKFPLNGFTKQICKLLVMLGPFRQFFCFIRQIKVMIQNNGMGDRRQM